MKKNLDLKKLAIAALLLSVLFIVLNVLVFYTLFYRRSFGVIISFPDFEGSYETSLPNTDGIKIVKNYASSDFYPEGVVISQDPPPLAVRKIPKGETPTLMLTVSTGKESFELDDLAGRTLTEAKTILRAMQCKIKIVRIYTDGENDIVSKIYPSPKSKIYAGDTVILYVQSRKITVPVIKE